MVYQQTHKSRQAKEDEGPQSGHYALTVAGEARAVWVAGWGPALSMMYAPGLLLIT